MRLIDRYIIRAHIGPFLFGFTIVMFLNLMQFLLNNLDKLVGKGLGEWVIIQLILTNLAWMAVLAVPMGILLSTLMAFGSMSASNEIMVLKSSGASLLRMMLPMIILGIIFSYMLYLFNDQILPDANHRAKTLMLDIKRKKPTFILESGRFSSELEGYTILSRKVDSASGKLFGVTIYDNRKGGEQNIISADTGIVVFTPDYSKIVLTLFDGEIHSLMPFIVKNGRKVNFQKYQIAIRTEGFAFSRTDESVVSRSDREMKISDMSRIVNDAEKRYYDSKWKVDLEIEKHWKFLSGDSTSYSIPKKTDALDVAITRTEAGHSARQRLQYFRSSIMTDIYQMNEARQKADTYIVEIQKKYAIPFACFVFIFVGCPLGIITRGGNFGFSAGISIGFYILYWACLIGGEKLSDRDYLSPYFSMWLGNIIVGSLGLILSLKVNNESLKLPFRGILDKIKKLWQKLLIYIHIQAGRTE